MQDWLVKRLTPAKRTVSRWTEFGSVIQTFWETLFDPEFDRISRMSSIYTADADGQRRIIADLGDYFEPDQADISIPISVAMRKLELAMKDTDYPIMAAIRRIGLEGSTGSSSTFIRMLDTGGSGKVGELQARWNKGALWQIEVKTTPEEPTPDVFIQDKNGSGSVGVIQAQVIGADDEGNDQWFAMVSSADGIPSPELWMKDVDGSRKSVLLEASIEVVDDGGQSIWLLRAEQSRYIQGEGVQWLPLWALESDGPYGTKFYNDAIGIPEGAYLTSRGVILADLRAVDQGSLDRIDTLIRKIKPLHIVYDGMIFTGTDFSQSFNIIAESGEHILTEEGDNIVT